VRNRVVVGRRASELVWFLQFTGDFVAVLDRGRGLLCDTRKRVHDCTATRRRHHTACHRGDEERLDADEKLAIEESHVEDSVVEESLDEVERFRWQL